MPVRVGPLAVIDIGSNSGRVLVARLDDGGHLDVVETEGTPLRLVHELAETAVLGESVVQRTLEVLRGFQTIARGAGAEEVCAVATSAVREASNGEAFVERLRCETGIDIEIINGELEARYGFVGAVYGIPADDGILIDIGGGSVQLASFRQRSLQRSWSLPLGALRLSDRFLLSDPPTGAELKRLEDYVRRSLKDAQTPRVGSSEVVVGTGGTLRNLAKLDRARRDYPIPRLHGYVLGRRELTETAKSLAQMAASQRSQLPGLNTSRFDSIVGGAYVAQVALEVLGGSGIIVSGHGLREGVVLSRAWHTLPPASAVRGASVVALAERFASYDSRVAAQRADSAEALRRALDPGVDAELVESLRFAALLLDVGRSVDFYRRHEHTVEIVRAADLAGFSHRAIALIGATVRLADKSSGGLKSWAPLLTPADQASLTRLGAILALADAVARQAPPEATSSPHVSRTADALRIQADWLQSWPLQSAARRVQQVFAVAVRVS
jgi:exopolyphosphatase/guanosine-5'-triphosphate,3'-diphosphate pyrophosphatase